MPQPPNLKSAKTEWSCRDPEGVCRDSADQDFCSDFQQDLVFGVTTSSWVGWRVIAAQWRDGSTLPWRRLRPKRKNSRPRFWRNQERCQSWQLRKKGIGWWSIWIKRPCFFSKDHKNKNIFDSRSSGTYGIELNSLGGEKSYLAWFMNVDHDDGCSDTREKMLWSDGLGIGLGRLRESRKKLAFKRNQAKGMESVFLAN